MIAPKTLLDRMEGQLLTGKIGRRCFTQASIALGTSFVLQFWTFLRAD